ncbi:SMI1/KNR4 family protein [Nonomuraea sp. SMC257]|uniref:SMI1/KNR4 family protein n=1 Tax=Nonomuraea montanisoli TaxID=2741721 RepID=A0A7Y6I8Z4_9ACTN|nr:SMI1/KNR4 family protein [Nonomuraea montanisoli]NUW33907.1 SMI1/KNR4 family protein [Nonomuraea montanisoli]
MWKELVERLHPDALFSGGASEQLYMPFNPLLFFADYGGGDQFAYVVDPGRHDIFVWDHETDSRRWVADNLEEYLRRRLSSSGDEWYRSD